jgi:hypothetical protein
MNMNEGAHTTSAAIRLNVNVTSGLQEAHQPSGPTARKKQT